MLYLTRLKNRFLFLMMLLSFKSSCIFAVTVTEAVRNYIDTHPGDTIANLTSFLGTVLNLANKNITDLTGLDTLDNGFNLDYSAIKYLTLTGNSVASISANIFSNFVNLRTLAFIINGVPLTLNAGCFNGLSNLQYLELGQNNISTIPGKTEKALRDYGERNAFTIGY